MLGEIKTGKDPLIVGVFASGSQLAGDIQRISKALLGFDLFFGVCE